MEEIPGGRRRDPSDVPRGTHHQGVPGHRGSRGDVAAPDDRAFVQPRDGAAAGLPVVLSPVLPRSLRVPGPPPLPGLRLSTCIPERRPHVAYLGQAQHVAVDRHPGAHRILGRAGLHLPGQLRLRRISRRKRRNLRDRRQRGPATRATGSSWILLPRTTLSSSGKRRTTGSGKSRSNSTSSRSTTSRTCPSLSRTRTR